jgi:hypothetical protein
MDPETLKAELIAALQKRLAVIGDAALRESDPARQLAELRHVSERIVELQACLPPSAHPQLLHYFERCSYDKALAWLEQEDLTATAR